MKTIGLNLGKRDQESFCSFLPNSNESLMYPL